MPRNDFNDTILTTLLGKALSLNKASTLMGDFNIDLDHAPTSSPWITSGYSILRSIEIRDLLYKSSRRERNPACKSQNIPY